MALDVLVVGLGFGRHFVPIYQSHPAVGEVGVVEPDDALRATVVTDRRLEHGYRDLDEALAGGLWDAVHVLSPVRFHHDQVRHVLTSGRTAPRRCRWRPRWPTWPIWSRWPTLPRAATR
ncbi:Gfo/Idh/MocA family oxidoreductase [Aestuariimicrobium soli]|uniref:Gfo/Idh/MocA family oxidoreductase n=1 Tax=Aestuariimicrobium soli TaxID=2035834 RepID=UPI003EB6C575